MERPGNVEHTLTHSTAHDYEILEMSQINKACFYYFQFFFFFLN